MKQLLIKSISHFLDASLAVKIFITGILTGLVYLLWPVFQFGSQVAFTIFSLFLGLVIWAVGIVLLFIAVIMLWTEIDQWTGNRGVTKKKRKG